jgi:mono/diheme cytochrome c family protein
MVLRLTLLCLLLAACTENKTAKIGDEEFIPASGKDIYNIHCTLCHGPNGDLGSGGSANLIESKLNTKAIKEMILNGNQNGMMPYKDILANNGEIDSLVVYVQSFRK